MALLEVSGLTVRYGRISALRDASIEVEQGEAVAVVGVNGAGKSTLLSAITGQVPVSAGTIELAGEPLTGLRPEQVVARGVSLVPEGRRIFGSLTVAENLMLGTTVREDDRVEADIESVLDRFPRLRDYYRSQASGLSGGEQQQLAIARALLANPRLLMLDEPSLGLAPKIVDLIFEILEELRDSGVTILLVEQNATRAVEFAGRSYLLKSGQVAGADGDDQARALADAYLGFGEEAR